MEHRDPSDDLDNLPPQERVAAVFRLAGYEVERRVGAEPGTVDWFAVPREGDVRPRTLFRALSQAPERAEQVLASIEAARSSSGADRAIAVIVEGGLPPGYVADLIRSPSNLLTFRRWFLEVSGIADKARELVREHQSSGESDFYLPRRGQLESGQQVQVEPFLEEWSQTDEGPTVVLEGNGKHTALKQARYRAALRYLERPDTTRLLCPIKDKLTEAATQLGFVLPIREFLHATPVLREQRWLATLDPPLSDKLTNDAIELMSGIVMLTLVEPRDDEIELWYERHLHSRALFHRLSEARHRSEEFSALTQCFPNLRLFRDVIVSQGAGDDANSGDAWTALVVVSYCRRVESIADAEGVQQRGQSVDMIEDFAMIDFALGSIAGADAWWEDLPSLGGYVEETWFDFERDCFRSKLIRDYFLAKKIVSEIEEGNEDFLFRHQFPRWALLFLTLLAPEIAARLTSGTIGRMEQKIQEEVERKLHLTFAHILNRPVGALRRYIEEIKDHLDQDQRPVLARPLARIEAEVDYLANLAEKTRLWRDEPAGQRVAVTLRALCEEVLSPLRQQHVSVQVEVQIEDSLRVSALPDALRESLHCILENAFHAALASSRSPSPSPSVKLSAYRLGESVRLELRDSGDGVAPADRERVFEPLVTTKTGGSGRPRGTGLGLAICKRYVEHMGGRVGLDPSPDETCFFVELVASKEDEA